MKRNHFILLSALMAWFFSLTMLFAPANMLGNLGAEITPTVKLFTQFLGTNLFAIGIINFLARNDGGSAALRGVMLGNVALHLLGMLYDWNGYGQKLINSTGVWMGTVVHCLLIVGFTYYLIKTNPAGSLQNDKGR